MKRFSISTVDRHCAQRLAARQPIGRIDFGTRLLVRAIPALAVDMENRYLRVSADPWRRLSTFDGPSVSWSDKHTVLGKQLYVLERS